MTTTVGIRSKDGVVLAADKRASKGFFVGSKVVQKIFSLDGATAVAIAGAMSDAEYLVNLEGRTSAARVASRLSAVREGKRETDLEHRVLVDEELQPVLRGARRRRGGPRRRPRVHERHERGDHLGGLHVLGQRFADRVRRPRAGVPQGVLARRGEEARGGRGARCNGTRSGQWERGRRLGDSERPRFRGGELRWPRAKWDGCRSSTTRKAGSSRSTTHCRRSAAVRRPLG